MHGDVFNKFKKRHDVAKEIKEIVSWNSKYLSSKGSISNVLTQIFRWTREVTTNCIKVT